MAKPHPVRNGRILMTDTPSKDGEKLVFPGEVIGSTEEYMPGSGVFEDSGSIKASQVGRVSVDKRSRRISVEPATSSPVVLKEGDVAIGEIYELRNSMAVVTLHYKEGNERPISSNSLGTLYISKISPDYIDNIRDAFYIGDVVRARVIQAQPSVQLDCADREMGVILADCPACNVALDDQKNSAKCPKCGLVLNKKLSSEYRKMSL